MAIAQVQSVTGNGATIVLNGVVAGNWLSLQTGWLRTTSTGLAEATPTDSNGTFLVGRADTPAAQGTDDAGVSIFYIQNAASGTHTATPQVNTATRMTYSEFSGLATSGTLDVGASGTTNNTAHTSRTTGTTAATAQADELILICLVIDAATGVADVGYTDPVSTFTTLHKFIPSNVDISIFQAFKVVSATGTQTATFNWTASEATMSSQAAIATFKAAAAADTLIGQACL